MERTPLYAEHIGLGARITQFAGWEMPLQYRGIIVEHNAVRGAAGLFDVSHMGELLVRGTGAARVVDRLATNDPSHLVAGQAMYTLLCMDDGGTVDDCVVYCRIPGREYLFVVNAANIDADAHWMRAAMAGRSDVELVDLSPETALLSLQGPRSVAILGRLLGLGVPDLATLRSFRFWPEVPWMDIVLMIARTGYTGEDGFEICCASDHAPKLWSALLTAGEPEGLLPCGLGARDTLRLEAALPLYGHELSPTITPLEAGLDRFVAWTDRAGRPRSFLGAEALRRIKAAGVPRRLVGLLPERPRIARAGAVLSVASGQPVGFVTSGTFSPTLGSGIALALARVEEDPLPLWLEVHGRQVSAERVALPFYRRRRTQSS